MCLTGVDYFSTLGYQPGIAFLAAGILSPIATFVLVLLSLFAALPVYGRVAEESPHGEGSISMLEALLPRWKGKLFVLVLLGFVATDFIITITLSAADATAHIIENPFAKDIGFLHHPVIITLALILFLGLVFLKGFKEAIGLAIVLVTLYLGMNSIVILTGIYHIIIHPTVFTDWTTALFTTHGNPFLMIGLALLLFPKLALGLSGFETGVAVMPLVEGNTTSENPIKGRIINTKKLLKTAALIMSVALLTSSIVTTTLIPAHEFAKGGEANGRALAYLAHEYLGDFFGTLYDVSTIMILWFAGSSAMAGLLNIVPRYLPRYGMAPEWARAIRPLVLVFTGIAFLVTIIFQADVDAQAGAYATGVLVLMTSAAVAVTLSQWKKGKTAKWGFMIISFAFVYTTTVNIIERPEGLQIALIFVAAIVFFSLISRVMRSTELRVETIEVDDKALELIQRIAAQGPIRIIANRKDKGDAAEYAWKENEKREDNHIPSTDDILFFEVSVADASTFVGVLKVRGVEIEGFKILRAESSAVPNAIAAFMLYLRDKTGKIPHIYFGWTEGNPLSHMMKYVAFGEGDTAPVTREVLRQAEKNADRRPSVHVGG
ncbi:MAG TPA: amino acid transporter [Patescibacteria group bacterium]|nr:amino acid transporter [Patescibacteria group bacterium]